MKTLHIRLSFFVLFLLASAPIHAQIPSNAQYQIAYKKPDAKLIFRWDDKGTPTPIEWGFDLAWLDESNLRRGIAFCGQEVVDIMRLSFQPTHSVENGSFASEQLKDLNSRISAVKKWCKSGITYNINCDHASLDPWYNDDCKTTAERAQHWAKLIDMTADYYKSKGLTNLVSISPLNEPDYEYHALPTFSHRMADFKEICRLLKTDNVYKDKYADVRICGGNTLNTDQAYKWWNNLKDYLDEGNTHQLAGSFDNYASFYETLRANNYHATNDELHNSMEAMVGAEYGLQTAIWWGSAERARGQFMKATYQGRPGVRLAYAENRNNWTSATIYRQPDGNVQGFAGCSERQASTTYYEYVSVDRDAYFNGQGPMRHFVLELPGGTGYGTEDQRSAETVFDIASGDDIQPYINGTYRIVNKYGNSKTTRGKYLGFSKNPGTNWTQLQQTTKPSSQSNEVYTQWHVTPVDNRIGGDFSYYDFQLVGNEKLRIDVLNWSLDHGGQVGSYPGALGNNEQWYLQYAGDGWFYIRSKHSNLALSCGTTSSNVGCITQSTFKEGDEKLLWRFIAADIDFEKEAPEAPTKLVATPQPASILLSWTAAEANDILGYDILRTEQGSEEWNTIGRNISTTSFIDNTAEDGKNYVYAVRATDTSINRSEMSTTVDASVTSEKALICQLDFDHSLLDATQNGNHAVMQDAEYNDKSTYVKHGTELLNLSNGNTFVQLPSTVSHHNNLTICCWVRRQTTTGTWERIFDFGNGQDQYMFLTPSTGSKMRFAIKNGGEEQYLDCPALTVGQKHVAVSIDGDKGTVCIYINGELKATSEKISIKPSDLQAVCNYIGRSQYESDPLFKGFIDDFRIYNYALSEETIAKIANGSQDETDAINTISPDLSQTKGTIQGDEFDLQGRRASASLRGAVLLKSGRKTLKRHSR